MTFSFSGPTLQGLVGGFAGAICLGTVYSSIANTNKRPIDILVGKEIADFVLYHFFSAFVDDVPRARAKVYAVTNLTVNVATLVVFRRLQLIGQVGTAVFCSLMAIEMTFKYANFKKYQG